MLLLETSQATGYRHITLSTLDAGCSSLGCFQLWQQHDVPDHHRAPGWSPVFLTRAPAFKCGGYSALFLFFWTNLVRADHYRLRFSWHQARLICGNFRHIRIRIRWAHILLKKKFAFLWPNSAKNTHSTSTFSIGFSMFLAGSVSTCWRSTACWPKNKMEATNRNVFTFLDYQ